MSSNPISYRRLTAQDVPRVLALKLAPKDAQEAIDGSGRSSVPLALLTCLNVSRVTWVIEVVDTGEIIGVFGLGSREGQVHPWFLGTRKVHKDHWMTLCKQGRRVVEGWSRKYPYMLNLVWEDNERAIRWLKWLGFRFPDEEPIEVNGNRYLKFEMKQEGTTDV